MARAGVALFIAALAIGLVGHTQASAETPASIHLVEGPSSLGVNLDGLSFPAAVAALDTTGETTVALNVHNLPPLDLTDVTVANVVNGQVGTLAITGTASDVSLGRLGETDAEVVVFARWADNDAAGARPQVILGLRVADPVTLATVAGDSFGDITDIITFPELAFVTHTSTTSGDVKLADLPANAAAWFDQVYGTTLPAKVNYLGHVTMIGALELDQFGDEVQAILGYGDGAEVVITGSLGITFADFQSGVDLTGDWALTALLPPTQLPQVARDLLQIDTAVSWTFGISYVEANKKLTTTVSGKVTGTALGGEREFVMTGVVSSFEKDGKTTLSVEITAVTSGWTGALGIDWLDLEEIKVVVKYTEVEGKDDDGKPKTTRVLDAKLIAKATVWSKSVTVTVSGKLGAKPEASVSIALNDPVSLGEVIDGIGLTDAFALLPPEALAPLRSITVNSLTLGVRVSKPDDEVIFEFTAAGSIQMTLGIEPNTLTMGAALLLVFDEDGRVTVGMRPDQTITMGDLLGLFGLDLGEIPDFPIVGGSGTGPFFGFVVTTKEIESVSSIKLSTAEADFYRPLFGNVEVFDVAIPQGVTALGTLPMPEPIRGFLQNTIGVSPIVTAKGSFPLFGPGDLTLELALKPDPENLPFFIDPRSKLYLKMEASISTPSLKLALGGDLRVRFKSGLPPEVADPLNAAGIPVQVAEPVDAGFDCPNGKDPEIIVESVDGGATDATVENYYCVDHLSGAVEGALTVSPTSVAVSISPTLKAIPADSVWYPFGQPWAGISFIGAKMELSWSSTAPPPGFSISGAFAGDMTVALGEADTDALVALKLGFTPLPYPPFVMVDFGGIRVASGQGLEFHEIIGLAEDTARIVDPSATIPTDALPNLAVRNLEFSFSPEGDKDVCLPQGLVISGDFYTDLTAAAPDSNPVCNEAGESVIPDPEDLCSNNWENGCFVSGALSVSTSGLEGIFEMAPFDLGPIHFGFDPGGGADRGFSRVEVAATLADQHFEIQSGVEIDNLLDPTTPLAKGDFSLSLRPTEFDYYGRLEILGFSALADGHASLNLLTSDSPELAMHILLATNQARVGASDFGVIVAQAAAIPLNVIETVFLVIDGMITDLDTDDGAVTVLKNLPTRLREAGLPVAGWMDTMATGVGDVLSKLKKYGIDIDIDVVLNGISFTVYHPWPPWSSRVTIPGICAVLPASVKEPSGRCSVAKIIDAALEPLFDDALGIPGLSLSSLRQGLRDLFEGDGPALTLTCVEFDLELNDQNQYTQLTVNAEIKGNPVGFGVGWDFSKSLTHNAGELVDGIIWAVSGRPPPTCRGLNTDLFEEQPPLTEPFLETTLDSVVDEGGSVTLEATFGVPLPASRTVRIDWGDGTVEDVLVAASTVSFSRTHTYADDDPTGSATDVVTVTALDLNDGTRTSHNVTIRNVAPSIHTPSLSATAIDENQTTTLTFSFDDVGTRDTHTAVVEWGDGTSTNVTLEAGARSAEVTHRYLDDHPTSTPQDQYAISVTVIDDDLGRSAATTAVTVRNVAPVGVSLTRNQAGPVLEGELTTFTIAFTDPGTTDTHGVQVDWDGDGIVDTEAGVPEGARTAVVSHTYIDDDPTGTAADPYTVTITILDDDTGTHTFTRVITVHNVLPTVDAGEDQWTYEDHEAALPPARFNDIGTRDTHAALVWWGDGTPWEAGVVTSDWTTPMGDPNGRDGRVDLTHVYPDPGIYTVTVCVADDDQPTTWVCDSMQMTVVHGFLKMALFGGADPDERPAGHGPGKLITHKDSVIGGWAGATAEVHLERNVTVAGSVVSVTDRVRIDASGSVGGDVVAGTAALVKRGSVVGGDVHAGVAAVIDGTATVTGGIFEGPAASTYAEVTWIESNLPGTGGRNVRVSGAPRPLPPGTYGKVVVRYGSMTMTSGVYRMTDLRTHRSEVFVDLDPDGDGVAEPLIVFVAHAADLDGSMTIVSPVGDASDIIFVVGDKVDLRKEGTYLGTFLTGRGDIEAHSEVGLIGALYGRNVEVSDRFTVTYLPAREAFIELFVPVIDPGPATP